MFTCRTCHVGEPASSYCVYQNKLNSQVGDTAGVTQDVGSDPTVCLPRFPFLEGFCDLCGDELSCYICGELPNLTPAEEDDDGLETCFESQCRLSSARSQEVSLDVPSG